jgi:two-component system response regulator DesR
LRGITRAPVPRPVRTLKLLIADDRLRTRRALRALLAALPDFEVVGEEADGEKTLACVRRCAPTWCCWTCGCPAWTGSRHTAAIKARWPAIRVVVHSLAIERHDDALAARADAFVPKGGRPDALLRALSTSSPAS